jgi:hypothetical protein
MAEEIRAFRLGDNEWGISLDGRLFVSYRGARAQQWAAKELADLIDLLPRLVSASDTVESASVNASLSS